MRILHTSDWHLGRSFGPVSLSGDQEAFVDWLVGVVAEESVDLVVIAGDIYDRSIPPTDAVVLFRSALQRLRATGARVAAITGNHDGADRVDTYHDLLDGSGVLLRGGYSAVGEVLTLPFDDGPLDLVLLPFLDPQQAPDDLTDAMDAAVLEAESGPDAGPDGGDGDSAPTLDAYDRRVRRSHQSVLHAAVQAARRHLTGARSLAVAHAFVAGAAGSDSERPLTVGGSGTVGAAMFRGFSYTALGHLHRPQRVGDRGIVRYSGTPLPYSFSEDHQKSVLLVDMAADGACEVREVPIPVGRPVLTVTGGIDALLRSNPDTRAAGSLVRAVLTDPGVVLDAKQRLAQVYPYVVEIVLAPPTLPLGTSADPVDRRSHTPEQVVDRFWLDAVGVEPTDAERAWLHDALVAARQDGA